MRHLPLNWKKIPELSGLGDLPTPPKSLYYYGALRAGLFTNCVALIGSRRMTQYGRRVIETIVPKLVMEKRTIVSGFTYGVDQYAHEVCVENGGKTIAVLGWGIRHPLEPHDRKLAHSIVDAGGLLISEWEEQAPTLWTFPVRNRIIVAICREVIVVEAAVKSGSLITATIAEKLKRPIWAVPGPITSPTSVGTNSLIASGKATMWLADTQKQAAVAQDPLLLLLTDEPLTTNEIARQMNKPVSEIGAELSLLAVSGTIVEREGKYYPAHAHEN